MRETKLRSREEEKSNRDRREKAGETQERNQDRRDKAKETNIKRTYESERIRFCLVKKLSTGKKFCSSIKNQR